MTENMFIEIHSDVLIVDFHRLFKVIQPLLIPFYFVLITWLFKRTIAVPRFH